MALPARRIQHTVVAHAAPDDASEVSTASTLEKQQQEASLEQGANLATSSPTAAAATNGNGNGASSSTSDDKDAPKHLNWVPDGSSLAPLQFTPLSNTEKGWTNFKLLFALPWRRFKPEAVLTFKLEGEISDKLQGRFSPGFSMPQILDSLEKAAVDPRIKGIAVEISPLAVSGLCATACVDTVVFSRFSAACRNWGLLCVLSSLLVC